MPHDPQHDHGALPHDHGDHGHDHGEAFPRIEIAERVAEKEQSRERLRMGITALFVALALALFALALPTEGVDAGVIDFVSGASAFQDSVITYTPAQIWVRRLSRAFDLRLEQAAFLLAAIAFGATLFPALFAARHFGLSRDMRWLAAGTLLTTLAAWLAGTRPHDSALGLLASTLLLATLSLRRGGVGSALLASVVWFWGAGLYAPIVWLFPALFVAITARAWKRTTLWASVVPVLALFLHGFRPFQFFERRTAWFLETPPLESTPLLFGLDHGWVFALAPGWALVAAVALVLRVRGDELQARVPIWVLVWLAFALITIPWRYGPALDAWTLLLPLGIPGAAALSTLLGDFRARRGLVIAVTVQLVVLLALLFAGRVERPAWLMSIEILLERDDLVITRDVHLRYLLGHRYGLETSSPRNTERIAEALATNASRIWVDGDLRTDVALPLELRLGLSDPDQGRMRLLPARDD